MALKKISCSKQNSEERNAALSNLKSPDSLNSKPWNRVASTAWLLPAVGISSHSLLLSERPIR